MSQGGLTSVCDVYSGFARNASTPLVCLLAAVLRTSPPARLGAVLLSSCDPGRASSPRSTAGSGTSCGDPQTLDAPSRNDPSGGGGDPLDEPERGLYATSAAGQSFDTLLQSSPGGLFSSLHHCMHLSRILGGVFDLSHRVCLPGGASNRCCT